ncbi:hypothetical protein A3759_17855 [Thalassolituus sp. HI0120]|nr:hypothetical protein A3759_17855 [Thalassolituus sp. HI0120]
MKMGTFNNKAERRLKCQLKLRRGSSLRIFLWWCFWLSLIVAGLLLSQWQWQRAQVKRAIVQQQSQTDTFYNPQTLPESLSQLTLTGYFIDGQSRWLDNRIYQGQVGVALITPFMDIHGRLWLVDRGFVNTQGERGTLEAYQPVASRPLIVVAGIWQRLDQRNQDLLLGNNQEGMRIQTLDLDVWPNSSQYFPGVLHLTSSSVEQLSVSGQHFIPWWRSNQVSPERHLGYSLQWFLLAVVAGLFAILGRRQYLN